MTPKLTTVAACRVARLDRQRFNEHVSNGDYPCAPPTVQGRTRWFENPNDLVPLMLFRQLMDDGVSPAKAGRIACAIGQVAREYPDEKIISYVDDYFYGDGTAALPSDVPAPELWDQAAGFFMGTDIRKVTHHNIGKLRRLIAHYAAEEASIIGADD